MLLLLTNQSRCPRCFSDRISRDLRRCMKCNAALLLPGDTGVWLEEQGLRSYYLWNRENGWVHSSHLANGMTKPNERFPKIEKLPDGYGTKPLPEGCSDK